MNISLTRAQWTLILALTLALAPYFLRLGASSLWDSNEAFYAETPREMIASGDYVNPTFSYRPRLNKPPLSYWIVVPFYKLFGVSETVERLPIALAAMVMIAAAFGLGRLLFSLDAGLFAALGLAIAIRFVMFSRRIMIDLYLATFMSLALLMLVLAQRQPERRRLFLILMYAFTGLAVITKGPVAAVLMAIVLVTYIALYRRLRVRELMLPAGLIIIVAVVLPWYVVIYFQHGWGYIETFLLSDNVSRYAQQVFGPRRGAWFYLPVIIGDFFPWSLFLVPLGWVAAQRLWCLLRGRSREQTESEVTGLLAIWIAVIVLFFSLSKSKEDLYILPVYPAAAAIVGGWFARGVAEKEGLLRRATVVMAAALGAVGVASLYFSYRFSQAYDISGVNLIAWVAIIGGLCALGAGAFKRIRTAIVISALTMIASNYVFVLVTLPDFERYKPVTRVCELISSEARPDALVGYYKAAYPSMAFYLKRPIFEYKEQKDLENTFASGKEVFCLMAESDYETLKEQLPPTVRVLASYPIFKVKLKRILDRVEPPQVVLISNKGGTNGAQ
ncbi:MAG TPA: glycosyltransferase family 39 protein [Blastocatellia bacterium]